LDDLRPIEDLVVDYIRHSSEVAEVLAVLASDNQPQSFEQIVRQTQAAKRESTETPIASYFVAVGLSILFIAGLVWPTKRGFLATATGRDVQHRIQRLSARYAMPTNDVDVRNAKIIMTDADQAQLETVITCTSKISPSEKAVLEELVPKLKRATITPIGEIPPDVIMLNSRAELLDLDIDERMQFTLVLPGDAEIQKGEISVLTTLGTAMLGSRIGDEFEWRGSDRVRRLKVTDVCFQPEAEFKKA